MEQRLINEIYWGPDYATAYAYGSRIKVDSQGIVSFENRLLPPGRILFTWHSTYNYQVSKLSPQLPLLRVGRRYRLVFKGTAEPAGTLIFRLVFHDLQGEEIKRLNLTGRVNEFTCPAGTVDYVLQLVNGGCTSFEFHRFELGPADMPTDANDDLWLQSGINDQPGQRLTLLLVADNKRYKQRLDNLRDLAAGIPIQVLSVCWQYQGDLEAALRQILKENFAYNIRLVSCNPAYDQLVLKLCQHFPSYQWLVTDRVKIINRPVRIQQYHWQLPATWLEPALAAPDWPTIFAALNGGEE